MPVSETSIKIFDSVRKWIEPALEAVGQRMDDFDARLKAAPQGLKGDKGEQGPGPTAEEIDSAVVKHFEELKTEFIKGFSGE